MRDLETDEDEYGTPAEPVPALFVDPSCTNLIKEFNNYKAPENTKGLNVLEAGVKQDDHALDALRYGLMHIFKLGAIYSLADVAELNKNKPADALPGNPANSVPTESGILALINGPIDGTGADYPALQAAGFVGAYSDTDLGDGQGYFGNNMEF